VPVKKIRVAVLMGGRSSERAISLVSGANVAYALDKRKYDVIAVDAGLLPGSNPPKAELPPIEVPIPAMLPATIVTDPETANSRPDVAFIALHGRGGEDGSVQGLLELLGIPYTGSGVLASALALNKVVAKKVFLQSGIATPDYLTFAKGEGRDIEAWQREAVARLGLPLVVKPAAEGSSIGVSIVRTEEELPAAAESALACGAEILAERYIEGIELTGAILGNRDAQVLPLVEIVPQGGFYDYERKYTPGATEEIVPARVPENVAQQAREAALAAHKALGCRGWSRVDMRADGDRVWVLEVNTIPGLTPISLVPCAAAAAGISFSALLDRLIELALEPE